MTDEINMNSLILMHYSIALTNGIEIESSFNDEPVEINMGSGDVTEGMELALFGLKEGGMSFFRSFDEALPGDFFFLLVFPESLSKASKRRAS